MVMHDNFQEQMTRAGCRVFTAPGPGEAARILHRIYSPCSAYLAPSSLTMDVTGQMKGWEFVPLQKAAAARLGIFEADLGIAETGSLCCLGSDLGVRLASSLPPISVALLRADRVVGSLDDVMGSEQEPLLFLITGPSRTADIEGILTLGVHGPGELTVILVGEVASHDAQTQG